MTLGFGVYQRHTYRWCILSGVYCATVLCATTIAAVLFKAVVPLCIGRLFFAVVSRARPVVLKS